MSEDTYREPEHGWTCFHCGETFTTIGAARMHFGTLPSALPGCAIRIQVGDERGWLMELRKLEDELARQRAINNAPDVQDFVSGVEKEALYQRQLWGRDSDVGKTTPDWFWLVGYLAGKGLAAWKADDRDKLLHHIITTAAACLNWHASILEKTDMRPSSLEAQRAADALTEVHT